MTHPVLPLRASACRVATGSVLTRQLQQPATTTWHPKQQPLPLLPLPHHITPPTRLQATACRGNWRCWRWWQPQTGDNKQLTMNAEDNKGRGQWTMGMMNGRDNRDNKQWGQLRWTTWGQQTWGWQMQGQQMAGITNSGDDKCGDNGWQGWWMAGMINVGMTNSRVRWMARMTQWPTLATNVGRWAVFFF